MAEIKVIQDLVKGTVNIKENCQYNNIEADVVTVHPYVSARLYGKVKDVIINKESKVFLHGEVSGNILNLGGEIHVFSHDK